MNNCEWAIDPESRPVKGCTSPAVVSVMPSGAFLRGVPLWVQDFRLCADHQLEGTAYLRDLLKVDVKAVNL